MITRRTLLLSMGAAISLGFEVRAEDTYPIKHSEAEWKSLLTPDQFAVLREEGTERPFTSDLLHQTGIGKFACAGCDRDAFSSEAKFDSGTGWPSFWAPIDDTVVSATTDTSFQMVRNAVHCTRCGGHLGHLFEDGPQPTGLRYCLNGVALNFHPA